MKQKHSFRIPLGLICVCFALFFFVFEDLGVRMIYLYAALGVILLVYIVFFPRLYISRIRTAFLLMALTALFFFLLPYSTRAYDMVAVIITIVFCAALSFFVSPDERELKAILKIIVSVAFAVSVYVIVIAFFPGLYINHISRLISELPRETTIRMLKMGYGVIIGGNAILVNHILVIALLILINQYVIFGHKKGRTKALVVIVLGLCAMLFENRKGELLVFALVCFHAFYYSGMGSARARIRKGIRFTAVSILVLALVVFVALKTGLADRYLVFLERFFGGEKQDISSGRFELWAIALNLFKEHPVLGVGWGSARNYIHMFNSANQSYIYNVHCLVLQLLCETGLIGCLAFMTPAVYIICRMARDVVWLRARTSGVLPNLAANVALQYQLFLLLNGMIDSTWHRMSFWPFYLISIVLAIAAERLGREEICNKAAAFQHPATLQEDK